MRLADHCSSVEPSGSSRHYDLHEVPASASLHKSLQPQKYKGRKGLKIEFTEGPTTARRRRFLSTCRTFVAHPRNFKNGRLG